MSRRLEESIVLISSAIDKKANVIGTGFAFYRKQHHTYFLSCAHVVEDVGGGENVLVNKIPAEVVAIGNKNGFDLAVLRVRGLLDIPQWKLRILAKAKGIRIKILGYYLFGESKTLSSEEIKGEVGEKNFVTQSIEGSIEQVIAWKLKITKGLLQKGYSGAPVVDSRENCVLGVATDMEGKGESGRAISVEALKEIWPEVPPELLDPPKVPKVYLFYAFFVGLLLGIPAQNFVKPIVCSLKQDLSLPFSISTCQKPSKRSEKNPFSIRLINNDNLTIENVVLETAKDGDVTCNSDDTVVYSCGQVSEPIAVSVTVNRVQPGSIPNSNTPPTPKKETLIAETKRNIQTDINVINNVNDREGDRLTIYYLQSKTNKGGSVREKPAIVIYDPPEDFTGRDTFTYQISDSSGAVSESITVNVNVNPTTTFDLEDHLIPFNQGTKKRYRKLKDILQGGKENKWRNADEETYFLMCHIKNKEEQCNLEFNEVKEFECEHLFLIDQLWKNASDEDELLFSLSYQKQKYLEMQRKGYPKPIKEWAKVLGWFDGTTWTYWQQWNYYDKEAPKGYYPMGGMFIEKYDGELDEEKVSAHAESLISCPKIKP
ncbi:MAG: GUN4 domain-containing protein [Microcoleaceae cyanobacterium]